MPDEIRAALKAMIWEEAKAKLRALVEIQGSYVEEMDEEKHSKPPSDPRDIERWNAAGEAVERFIEDFEGMALYK